MPQRIRPTEVSAAYRAAVAAADLAGIDTEGWELRRTGSNFMIGTRGEHGSFGNVPGLGVYMGGYFATSYREAYDALHWLARAWDMAPGVGRLGNWPCWHVEASNGMVYGVASKTKAGAFAMLNARLASESEQHHAVKAVKVSMWDVDYGTVLCYGEGKVV
jgi:hypothetical protein